MPKMDEMKRRKFQRLNSPEMYKAVACLWAFGICLLSTFLALKWGIEFVAWAIAPVGLIALFCAIWYYARSEFWLYDEAYAEYATEDEEDNEPPSPPIAHSEITPKPARPFTDSELRKRSNFYNFVYGVCKQRAIGEGTWEKRGLGAKQYQEWIALLKKIGVVSTPKPGGTPEPLLGFDEALRTIALAGNDPDYWLPVLDYYRPASSNTTLLLLQDA